MPRRVRARGDSRQFAPKRRHLGRAAAKRARKASTFRPIPAARGSKATRRYQARAHSSTRGVMTPTPPQARPRWREPRLTDQGGPAAQKMTVVPPADGGNGDPPERSPSGRRPDAAVPARPPGLVAVEGQCRRSAPVHESIVAAGVSPTADTSNAIDATPARWRGGRVSHRTRLTV